MPSRSAPTVARQVEALFAGGSVAGLPDGALLERFLAGDGPRAERAFEALVARHGPLVRGICRRIVLDPSDADDAFQATFLVLVRRAGSVRVDDSLGRWLAGVARRVAGRVRADRERRRRREQAGELIERAAPAADLPTAEVLHALDAEVARLAEPFRSAVVLCDLGGRTHEQAALDLGCPVGTVKSRLARGRSRLKARLTRRGFDGPLGLALVGPAAVSPRLVDSTVRLALASIGPTSRSGWFGLTGSFTLKDGVARMMFAAPTQWVAGTALTVAMAATGWTWMASHDGDETQQGRSTTTVGHQGIESGVARAAPAVDPQSPADYIIEPPDILAVEVLDAPPGRPITGERPVRPDGKISLGSYGEVRVGDLTTTEAKVAIVEHLRGELGTARLGLSRIEDGKSVPVEPARSDRVHVDVLSYNSKAYYVQGEVRKPGRLPVTGNETVRDAIHLAGGIVATGQILNVRLVRPALKRMGGEYTLPINLGAIEDGTDLTTNYRMLPGDRLVVFRDPTPAGPAGPAIKSGSEPGPDLGGSSRPDPQAPLQRDPVIKNIPREFSLTAMPAYVVQPPDMIRVQVLEALAGRPITGERLVHPDGTISLDYYGSIYVAGLTCTAIKEKIILHLKQFLSDDQLGLVVDRDGKPVAVDPGNSTRAFVEVVRFNSKVYYVLGDVGSPGRLPITGGETVLDAITFAGGLIPTGSVPSIRLVRPAPLGTGAEQILPVDYAAIATKGDTTTNYQLRPGDRLVVERDAKVAAKFAEAVKAADPEARVAEMERKLDLILQKLEGKREKP